jgi:mannose-6-phosphate isomerase-like protein (cupin superfamily)
MKDNEPWSTRKLPAAPDDFARDGAEVRILQRTQFSSAIHGVLPAGQISRVTRNRWIHEIWYFVSGTGTVWRRSGQLEEVVDVSAETLLTIPPDTIFQYASSETEPVIFLCFVSPPFPGPQANEVIDNLETPLGRPTIATPVRVEVSDLHLNDARQQLAPDGSLVYLLASIDEGGTAVFELAPGMVARPVRHPRVQEIWFVLSGKGRIWRCTEAGDSQITDLHPGVP